MNKILIAYYSRRGENYVGGVIKKLKTGNTERGAGKIAERINADLFEIETVEAYPADYTETTNVAMAELKSRARPELTSAVKNIDQYNTVILVYPNWWGTAPMCVFTFLESHDLTGKTILPFCTHEGSSLGHSVKDIAEACPDSKVRRGLAVRGGSVDASDKAIENWLRENNLI